MAASASTPPPPEPATTVAAPPVTTVVPTLAASPTGPVPVTLPPGLVGEEDIITMVDPTWIALRPSDLPGQGYGVVNSSISVDVGALVESSTSLGLPYPDDIDTLQRKLTTIVSVFGDPDAAHLGLEDDRSTASSYPETVFDDAAPVFGEESFVTTFEKPTNDGTATTRNVSIVMRVGAVVVEVSLSDFSGATPTADELTPITDIVIGRANAAQADPSSGLLARMVRIRGNGADWVSNSGFQGYSVVDGALQPGSRFTAGTITALTEYYAAAAVDDVLRVENELTNDATGQSFGSSTWIYTFADDATAAAYLPLAVDDALASTDVHSDIAAVDVTDAAGPAAAVTWKVTTDDGEVRDGVRVWVQSGPAVASVLIERAGGVPIELVRDLANLQAACAQSSGPCLELEVPAVLGGPAT